jgi:hypothetical protein
MDDIDADNLLVCVCKLLVTPKRVVQVCLLIMVLPMTPITFIGVTKELEAFN